MKFNNHKAQEEITNYVLANYNKIEVNSGTILFNYKCHKNAVHIAKVENHNRIAMCVYIDHGGPVIHFLNYHNEKFVDNTLGVWTERYHHYFVKWIEEEDFWQVDSIFGNLRTHFRSILSWWVELTSDYGG